MTTTEKQKNAAWQIQLTGEVLLFGLLGKTLYEIPTPKGIKRLVDNEVFTEAPFADTHPDVLQGLALLEKWSHVFQQDDRSDDLFKELQVDYTKLFTGMRKLPIAPWESVYFSDERLVFQEQTMDVRAWYRRYGLEVERLHQEPEDHIGLELLFVAHLAQLGLKALNSGNNSEFEQALTAQRDFLSKHLLLWGPLWCEQMLEYAQTDFYRGLALVIRGALRELSRILEISQPEAARS